MELEPPWVYGVSPTLINGCRNCRLLEVTSSKQEPTFCSTEPGDPLNRLQHKWVECIYVQFLWGGRSETVCFLLLLFLGFFFSPYPMKDWLTKETASDHSPHLNKITNPELRRDAGSYKTKQPTRRPLPSSFSMSETPKAGFKKQTSFEVSPEGGPVKGFLCCWVQGRVACGKHHGDRRGLVECW